MREEAGGSGLSINTHTPRLAPTYTLYHSEASIMTEGTSGLEGGVYKQRIGCVLCWGVFGCTTLCMCVFVCVHACVCECVCEHTLDQSPVFHS